MGKSKKKKKKMYDVDFLLLCTIKIILIFFVVISFKPF